MGNDKKKIVFVCRRLDIAGGKERVIVNTANLLAGIYDVSILQLTTVSVPFFALEPGVTLHSIDGSNAFGKKTIFAKFVGFLKDILAVRKFINTHHFDVVVSVDYIVSSMFVINKSFHKKPILVGWEHIGYDNPWLVGTHRRIKNLILKFLDYLVVLTRHDEKVYREKGIRVTTIPNARSFESNIKSTVDNKKILTIGRLSPQKGIDYLIDVIRRMEGRFAGWKFILIAQNDLFTVEDLMKTIKSKGIEHILEVHKPTNNVIDYYLESSIYLMTSRNEGLPMVLIEAMECGLPCVSFDCKTGPSDIIQDGFNGKLIECFEIDKMIDALALLINNPAARREMGRNAALSVQKFSEDRIKEEWSKFLNIINDKS